MKRRMINTGLAILTATCLSLPLTAQAISLDCTINATRNSYYPTGRWDFSGAMEAKCERYIASLIRANKTVFEELCEAAEPIAIIQSPALTTLSSRQGTELLSAEDAKRSENGADLKGDSVEIVSDSAITPRPDCSDATQGDGDASNSYCSPQSSENCTLVQTITIGNTNGGGSTVVAQPVSNVTAIGTSPFAVHELGESSVKTHAAARYHIE